MKRFWLAAMAFAGVVLAVPAQASVQISINLTTQRMQVRSSTGTYVWPVSTARAGFVTPRGSFSPYSLQRMHYSRAYGNAPMPHSIFFHGGWAIHGTGAVGALGRPASHGCVRLAPGNAAALYAMVQREGASISISGSAPASKAFAAKKPSRYMAVAMRGRPNVPMAYAPTRWVPEVRSWQANPYGW